MNKTKIVIIVAAVIVAATLIVLGVKFAGKSETDSTSKDVTSTDTETTTKLSNGVPGVDYTTLKPFIDSQIEVLPPTTSPVNNNSVTGEDNATTNPSAGSQNQSSAPTTTKTPSATNSTTDRYEEHAIQLDKVNGWKDDSLTIDLPKIYTNGISTSNYISDKGHRTVIRIQNFDYSNYLTYVDRLENAGFADNNNRAHIPSTAPSTVAMFYSRFDGKRSFGVYWYGDASRAGFDCEIVISDYDQAK